MLGKTNITALSESTYVTEIEDYNWIQVQSGIFSDFVKAIYKGGYLVAITADGKVVYTADGEVWQAHALEYEECKLKDVDWDGSRFLLTGSCIYNEKKAGILLETTGFEEYTRICIENESDSEDAYDTEYCAVYPSNSKYLIVARRKEETSEYAYIYVGNLANEWENMHRLDISISASGYYYHSTDAAAVKNSNEMLLYVNYRLSLTKYNEDIYHEEIKKINSDGVVTQIYGAAKSNLMQLTNVFECKDALFYESVQSAADYKIVKVLSTNEQNVLSTGQNFSFKDAVYYNECQIFINSHEMLVVKPKESIADKTTDDLIEIAPELTMNCITKAFGQLYLFGNYGAILKSSTETNNEEAIAVQVISAKKALADAKSYTDAKCEALEARIAALEMRNVNS